MEGVIPQDDTSHFIDEEETRPTRPQTRDTKMEGNWFGNGGYNISSDAKNIPLNFSKGTEVKKTLKRPTTGKSEFRNIRKNSDHQSKNGTINIMKDNELDFNTEENYKHLSHGKFTRKSGPGNPMSETNPLLNFSGKEGRPDGHNYTVSINFNRPLQSKGKRIKINDKKREAKKAWNKVTESPKQNKKKLDIYNYDIDPQDNFINGLLDVDSSTRKRPSKTAGKKRGIGSLRAKNHKKNKDSFQDSNKLVHQMPFDNAEQSEGIDFNDLFNDNNEHELEGEVDFKSQTTKLPFHSSLGTDFLNLFANRG
uniref:Uncharacterized protein n=1 Tax=Euplotes crassus TaxID=5936 RepID=A0A7S3KTM9_EUPCR|mmetsp:Transcript_39015/g.38635  ORF Transcript_39015/g.38635 Transcript_39015/m.38635 type:complete len:309 (+) Transcript_39015:871-1797(+)